MSHADLRGFIEKAYPSELFRYRGIRFLLQPLNHFFHQNLEALARIADDLGDRGGWPVWHLLKNRRGKYLSEWNGQPSVLMATPGFRSLPPQSTGTALADFHRRTLGVDRRLLPESPRDRTAKDWITLIDDLEKQYSGLRGKKDQTVFERVYSELFPYFHGCAENAIQILVDASTDFPADEAQVMTHYRFAGKTALNPENPGFWVADDRSRDLAEWLRRLAWGGGKTDPLQVASEFLDDYERLFPLTDRQAACMFARLLYPLSYVECALRYFSGDAQTERERSTLERILQLNRVNIAAGERMMAAVAKKYSGRFQMPEWLIS